MLHHIFRITGLPTATLKDIVNDADCIFNDLINHIQSTNISLPKQASAYGCDGDVGAHAVERPRLERRPRVECRRVREPTGGARPRVERRRV